ncbi:uncharacterized protein isoform X1 [Danio rerio]|uniref:Uncharacterized protein isoform X1 n=1 Tax=Danio rerio TaxID=7955 RepID=A0AC58HN52_DANRE|nr:uncharacterized protein LOC553566 isoform X1 [Danio rerio]|eukprot:XP_005158674.1 uncharacterized protein LOC553566 isoform X1 [Danio rerio]
MNFNDAKNEILQVLSKTERQHLPKLLEWIKTSDDLDDILVDNQSVILHSIAEDLRACLPMEAMAPSETLAMQKGYLYSAASQLVGVEMSSEFVKLQSMAVEKYGFSDRIQVIHADIRSQIALVQKADVLIMNNVFEYFMEPRDQMQAWLYISQNFRKKGALLVTVPSIQEALGLLQDAAFLETLSLSQWIEEIPVDYSVYLKNDTDPDSLKQIHLYRVL